LLFSQIQRPLRHAPFTQCDAVMLKDASNANNVNNGFVATSKIKRPKAVVHIVSEQCA